MKYLLLGKGAKIHSSAIVGCRPGRGIVIKKTKIGKNALIRSNAVIYTNVRIGDNLETGHNVVIREEAVIGDDFRIWNNSVVDYGCVIGNRVKIHSNVYVAQFTTIEDDCFIAPGVVMANDLHPECKRCMKGPFIKQGARVGANVTLLPAVIIGRNSLIGAGSVVTKDIPEEMLAFGNPAKTICSIYDLRCKSGLKQMSYLK